MKWSAWLGGVPWEVPLDAGLTYFLIADGLFMEDIGSFTFSLAAPTTR